MSTAHPAPAPGGIPVLGPLSPFARAAILVTVGVCILTLAVSYGSSLQVALFVGPVLVLLVLLVGKPMNLDFHPLEVAAVGAAIGISALIALDGESNWLEGALLVIVYVILAGSFFELPSAG